MIRCMDQFYKLLKDKNYRFLLLHIILIEFYSNSSKENISIPYLILVKYALSWFSS